MAISSLFQCVEKTQKFDGRSLNSNMRSRDGTGLNIFDDAAFLSLLCRTACRSCHSYTGWRITRGCPNSAKERW